MKIYTSPILQRGKGILQKAALTGAVALSVLSCAPKDTKKPNTFGGDYVTLNLNKMDSIDQHLNSLYTQYQKDSIEYSNAKKVLLEPVGEIGNTEINTMLDLEMSLDELNASLDGMERYIQSRDKVYNDLEEYKKAVVAAQAQLAKARVDISKINVLLAEKEALLAKDFKTKARPID